MIQLPNIEKETEFHLYIKPLMKVADADSKLYSYYYLERAKKHHPWHCVAFFYSAGDSCTACAVKHFKKYGYEENYPLKCIVDNRQWHKLQVTQHLKIVKMNR